VSCPNTHCQFRFQHCSLTSLYIIPLFHEAASPSAQRRLKPGKMTVHRGLEGIQMERLNGLLSTTTPTYKWCRSSKIFGSRGTWKSREPSVKHHSLPSFELAAIHVLRGDRRLRIRYCKGNVELRKLYPRILMSFFQNAGGGGTTARFHYQNTPSCYSLCLKENSLRSNDVNYRNGGGGGGAQKGAPPKIKTRKNSQNQRKL